MGDGSGVVVCPWLWHLPSPISQQHSTECKQSLVWDGKILQFLYHNPFQSWILSNHHSFPLSKRFTSSVQPCPPLVSVPFLCGLALLHLHSEWTRLCHIVVANRSYSQRMKLWLWPSAGPVAECCPTWQSCIGPVTLKSRCGRGLAVVSKQASCWK